LSRVVALAALAATVALSAGCGGGSHPPPTTRAATGTPECTLSAKQRRLIRRLKHMIVRMHQLEAPLNKVQDHGPMPLELELNRFLLTVGFLPVKQREDLIREAKGAVGLCRDCFDALEAIEPSIQTRLGESPCKAGS
jgi:hypothetical protein